MTGLADWQWSSFDALSKDDLYAVLAVRQQVFVVEQRCAFQDADGYDEQAFHLLGWCADGAQRKLVAYLRCLPPGIKNAEIALGRVLCVPAARGVGLGRALLEQGIREAERQFPGRRIGVSAQLHLEAL